MFAPHGGPALLRSGRTVDQTAVVLFSVDVPADALAAPGTFDGSGATATVVADRQICATLGCGIDGGLIPLGVATGEIENVEPASTVDGVAGITHQVWHLRWDLTFGDSADLSAFSAYLVGDDVFEY